MQENFFTINCSREKETQNRFLRIFGFLLPPPLKNTLNFQSDNCKAEKKPIIAKENYLFQKNQRMIPFFYVNGKKWQCKKYNFRRGIKYRLIPIIIFLLARSTYFCKLHIKSNRAHRPRMDLNKRFLPRPNNTTAWKLIPHRSKISKNWNPPRWELFYLVNEFECNYCKAVFVLVKIRFWKIYVVGPTVGDYNSCWF